MSLGKIQVIPISLEPIQGGYGYSAFYPLGGLIAYAKAYKGGHC